jgi:hypothetical protein
MRHGLRAGFLFWELLLTLPHAWADMTPAQAFEAGKAFGQSPQGAAAVKGSISGANAVDQVPHHGTSHPHSALYDGGKGDPRTPGGNRVTECATAHYADARQQVECDAINDLANNRSARPPLAIVPADPILVKGAAVKADPASVAGAFGGAYGACTTTTVTRPATYEEEVCNEFKTLGEEVCHKVLNVTVRTDKVCVMGTYEYPYTFTTHDVGGESWRIDSLCAGGTIRVQCWSGGYQNRSFAIPLGRTDTSPVLGTTCWPHTRGKNAAYVHHFYYSHQICDSATRLCQATLYDVPGWDPYRYACPAGQVTGDQVQVCSDFCWTLDKSDCYRQECSGPIWEQSCNWVYASKATVAGINVLRSWTQSFHSEGETYSFEDSWNDQCTLLEARTQ